MENIKSKLGQGGLVLGAMGIISALLSIFNYNIRLLAWIDIWGSVMGWILRIILVLGGGTLFFLFGRAEEEEALALNHKKQITMKNIKQAFVVLICITVLWSCGGGASKQPATADGFAGIEKELKSEFGDEAYYTDLTIMYNESIGNSIVTTVTDDPESLKMGQWTYSLGNWNQTSEVTLEIPDGTKAADFMFQLDKKISLEKLGELAEKSKDRLKAEKAIDNPRLEMAFVKYPKNGDIKNAEYIVKLQPENGGTSYTFSCQLDGTFIKMDY